MIYKVGQKILGLLKLKINKYCTYLLFVTKILKSWGLRGKNMHVFCQRCTQHHKQFLGVKILMNFSIGCKIAHPIKLG